MSARHVISKAALACNCASWPPGTSAGATAVHVRGWGSKAKGYRIQRFPPVLLSKPCTNGLLWQHSALVLWLCCCFNYWLHSLAITGQALACICWCAGIWPAHRHLDTWQCLQPTDRLTAVLVLGAAATCRPLVSVSSGQPVCLPVKGRQPCVPRGAGQAQRCEVT